MSCQCIIAPVKIEDPTLPPGKTRCEFCSTIGDIETFLAPSRRYIYNTSLTERLVYVLGSVLLHVVKDIALKKDIILMGVMKRAWLCLLGKVLLIDIERLDLIQTKLKRLVGGDWLP